MKTEAELPVQDENVAIPAAAKKRGRKAKQPVEAKAKAKRGRPRSKPTAASASKVNTVSSAQVESKPIALSNIDLELINRILNMNSAEKIELLKKII